MANPHTAEAEETMTAEEYDHFLQEYELWRQMRDSQRYRVNGGDDTIHEPIGEENYSDPF